MIEVKEIKLPFGRGQKRLNRLKEFANQLLEINKSMDFKVSSRGWCYQLENFEFITKGEFKKTQKFINEARELGFLPLDFTAEDNARAFSGIYYPTSQTPEKYMKSYLESPLQLGEWYDFKIWEDEKYYLAMMVEKVDLVSLFEPIIEKFHIPITNSRGWYSLNQRGNIANLFKTHEAEGRQCVLLYCGDHDPFGMAISKLLMKNLKKLENATGWNPRNLIIDRFGLNEDFINKNKLSWIQDLISGSDKKPDKSNPIISKYIKKYGERKCEANALVINPTAGRELCQNAIEKYLGKNFLSKISEKRMRCIDYFDAILDYYKLRKPLKKALESMKGI